MSDTIIINYPTDEGLTINIDDNDDVIVNIIDEPNIIVNLCDDLGTTANNYDYLDNKPSINNVELVGNKTLDDLGIEPAKGADNNFVTDAEKAELHSHSNKSVLDSIIQSSIDAWNIAYNWVSSNGAAVLSHITDSSIHVTSTLLSTINNKVDKVTGKGLSTNDFTDDYKSNGLVGAGNTTLTTLKQVADKAQFAPNENGTILYHTTKWFTPTGTISTNGTTATSTSAQFNSGMVGAKLTILGEEKIIASYISSTQVTVDSAYSQDYNSVDADNWSVYSVAYVYTGSNHRFYAADRSLSANIQVGAILQLNEFRVFFARLAYSGLDLSSNFKVRWSNSPDAGYASTKDVGFSRNSAGVIEVNDGNTAGAYRDVNLRNLNYYGTLNNASDERLKHGIRPVNDGLEKVCKLAECVKHFEFNNQDIYAKGQRTGFVAQLLKENGFEGHVSEREPANEEEGAMFGWTYKDEEYEEVNQETQETEIKTRRIVDVKGDMVLQVENNFLPYLYPAVAELKRQNDELRDELTLIKQKLGIA